MSHFRGLSLQNITLITEITFQVLAMDGKTFLLRSWSKKKKKARGFTSCTAITMRYTILHLAILSILITSSYYQCNTSSILHRIRGFILHLHFFLNLNSSISQNRSSYKLLSRSYPLMFSMESFMQRNMELFLRYDKENKICTETIRAYRKF